MIIGTLITGALAGYLMEKYSVALIRKRTSEENVYRFSGKVFHTFCWMSVNALCWMLLYSLGGFSLYTIESAIVLSLCIVLSAVDISIRKIPNDLLLLILGTHFLAILAEGSFDRIFPSLAGSVFGFLVFMLPFFFGKGAGLGDVKLAIAAGFVLGTQGLAVSVLIMTLFLVIYTVYLILSHKGGLKTQLALGPFMASGIISVMILEMISLPEMMKLLGCVKYL